MKKLFMFALMAVVLLSSAVVLTACGGDDDDKGSGKTFYVTLKYAVNDDIVKSSISNMIITITNPEGSAAPFSSTNADDWRTIFYPGTWTFDVTAKGETSDGTAVDIVGTASKNLTGEGELTIQLYRK